MEKGLKIPSLLVSLMNQLEKDKKSLKLGNEDYLYVEGFALNVFSKADKQDRAGRADLNTAKTFYAASIFFEILYQFGELQPDIEQKQKYAVWKAADIRKALKEGRKPVPETSLMHKPTRGSLNQQSVKGSDASYSHPSFPSATETPPTVQYNSSSDDGYRGAKPAAPPAAPKYTYDSNYQPEPEKITEAHKAARFAVGALAFDDVPVAVEFLSRSLELLTNPSASVNSSSPA
ncbi:hypothetical protein QJS10_CPB15g01511 [Acorus calamus]|uniref:Uncharacterized protein n=1 Tax=Acorus calamus TaxID=4465 RepID=A0AAV9D4P3_ACOCL|nr:hypothetical protein QJS10_CPB15g01511 [Acorus calamus]